MLSTSHAIALWLSVWRCVAVRRCEGSTVGDSGLNQQMGVKIAKGGEEQAQERGDTKLLLLMEIAISSELGMNVNVFELHVDSLMPSLFSLTSSIAILAFLVPSCSVSLKMLIFDHVSPPASTHYHTLNQSLVVPSRYTQGRSFQPIVWVISHLWPENSPVN